MWWPGQPLTGLSPGPTWICALDVFHTRLTQSVSTFVNLLRLSQEDIFTSDSVNQSCLNARSCASK